MKKINVIFSWLKGITVAVAVTVLGVALLALFLKNNDGKFVSLISVIIKVVSICLGTVLASLKSRKRGALNGIAVSVPYWIVCMLLSLLVEPLQFSFRMLLDLLLTVFIGIFAGILTVNTVK